MCKLTSESFEKEEEPQEDGREDMRWQLSEEEKEGVRELKEAADAQGLFYKNLFELAKYYLVVRSIENDPNLRPKAALNRLRKRHEWLLKHKLLDIDEVAAHAELGDHSCPQHFVQRFRRDRSHNRAVVATHMAHSPLSFIQKSETNKRKYLAAAMYRMDLGAVDMEEARRGMVLATISEGQFTLGRAFKYMRFMNQISSDMKDMHPHTVKAVHTQFPSLVAHMLPAVKHVLPKKVADPIHAYTSIEEMYKALEPFEDENDNMNGDKLSASEWARLRHERYQETVAKLSLD